MQLTHQQIQQFHEAVWDYYREHKRIMAWREHPTPYSVLVSELMLQQTQVNRVLPKFQEFMLRFPTVISLADAPLAEVLRVWSGLGYNRRAKFLHAAAQVVVEKYGGVIPATFTELVTLPGVGKNTAGAVLAYAYNQPVVFIETNIRSVFFHHFFADVSDIDDKDLLPLIQQTLDQENPREWYWALMDYGAHLKQTAGNNIARSRHYARQSKFEGSRRQIRGRVVRALLRGPQPLSQLAEVVEHDQRLPVVLQDLAGEGFVVSEAGLYRLTDF